MRRSPTLPYVAVVRSNGAAIKALREATGLGLRDLARATNRDPGFISRLERGEREASPPTLRAIADALRVPLAAITSPEQDTQRDSLSPEEAAREAYVPGGPSVEEITALIRELRAEPGAGS